MTWVLGMAPGADFQGTKNALARADTVCVFAGVAVVHSDRAAALRLKKLIES